MSTEPAGFIAHHGQTIWGTGRTEGEALAAALAGVRDTGSSPELMEEMEVSAATASLIAGAGRSGVDVEWIVLPNGVAGRYGEYDGIS